MGVTKNTVTFLYLFFFLNFLQKTIKTENDQWCNLPKGEQGRTQKQSLHEGTISFILPFPSPSPSPFLFSTASFIFALSILFPTYFSHLSYLSPCLCSNFTSLFRPICSPLLFSLFTFILFANLFSNIPYSYGFTTSVIVCLGLSFIIFVGVTIIGITTHKIT